MLFPFLGCCVGVTLCEWVATRSGRQLKPCWILPSRVGNESPAWAKRGFRLGWQRRAPEQIRAWVTRAVSIRLSKFMSV